jgi:hypothetical protein
MRVKYVHALVCGLSLTLSGLTAHADEAPTTRVALHIEPQPVRAALKAFSDQTGVQVLLRVDNISVDQLVAPRIDGQLTVRAALDRILRNSGLKYEFVNDRTVRISVAVEAPPISSSHASSTTFGDDPPGAVGGSQSNTGNSSTNSPGASQASEPKLEEILVTAQKKSERAQDVPVPLTIVDTQALANSGAGRIQDYYATVPGLSLLSTPGGGGTQYVTLRGLSTTANTGPTVAMTIDDVPFGLIETCINT